MTRRRTIGIAVAFVAVGAVAALGAAAAIAASGRLSPEQESRAFLDDAAARLGVEPSELRDALKEALESRVDAAVEAGRLTEAQGDVLKERIEASEAPFLHGGPGLALLGPWPRGHHEQHDHLEAAAAYLGIDGSELRDRLVGGETLADVARAEGKTPGGLVQALVAEATSRLDEAVADGRLTQERADAMAETLEERITDLVNGERPERGFGRPFGSRHHPGFGPSFGDHQPGFGPSGHAPRA
jgi:hypothetical protein